MEKDAAVKSRQANISRSLLDVSRKLPYVLSRLRPLDHVVLTLQQLFLEYRTLTELAVPNNGRDVAPECPVVQVITKSAFGEHEYHTGENSLLGSLDLTTRPNTCYRCHTLPDSWWLNPALAENSPDACGIRSTALVKKICHKDVDNYFPQFIFCTTKDASPFTLSLLAWKFPFKEFVVGQFFRNA